MKKWITFFTFVFAISSWATDNIPSSSFTESDTNLFAEVVYGAGTAAAIKVMPSDGDLNGSFREIFVGNSYFAMTDAIHYEIDNNIPFDVYVRITQTGDIEAGDDDFDPAALDQTLSPYDSVLVSIKAKTVQSLKWASVTTRIGGQTIDMIIRGGDGYVGFNVSGLDGVSELISNTITFGSDHFLVPARNEDFIVTFLFYDSSNLPSSNGPLSFAPMSEAYSRTDDPIAEQSDESQYLAGTVPAEEGVKAPPPPEAQKVAQESQKVPTVSAESLADQKFSGSTVALSQSSTMKPSKTKETVTKIQVVEPFGVLRESLSDSPRQAFVPSEENVSDQELWSVTVDLSNLESSEVDAVTYKSSGFEPVVLPQGYEASLEIENIQTHVEEGSEFWKVDPTTIEVKQVAKIQSPSLTFLQEGEISKEVTRAGSEPGRTYRGLLLLFVFVSLFAVILFDVIASSV